MENLDLVIRSTAFASIIGVVAPFVFPFIFKLFKRELDKEEKRLLITLISIVVSVVILAFNYNWSGDFKQNIGDFAYLLALNFATFKGSVQVVYEAIIKNISKLQ